MDASDASAGSGPSGGASGGNGVHTPEPSEHNYSEGSLEGVANQYLPHYLDLITHNLDDFAITTDESASASASASGRSVPASIMSGKNDLMSDQPSADGVRVVLHPMVLICISDYFTRHALRQQKGPVCGALLGVLEGREIQLEHAFDLKLKLPEPDSNDEIGVDMEWMADRIQQYKVVQPNRPVDLMGWWTTAPLSGPQPEQLHLHRQVLSLSESAVLIAFHPDALLKDDPTDTKIPLTVYESIREAVPTKAAEAEAEADGGPGEAMDVEQASVPTDIRFREVDYALEMPEAELIAVQHVAKHGIDALDFDEPADDETSTAKQPDTDSQEREPKEDENDAWLTPEEREMIATLTAKANAIKMMQSRLRTINMYLANLEPCYYNNFTNLVAEGSPYAHLKWHKPTEVRHHVIRTIGAMCAKMNLVIPPNTEQFHAEMRAEREDAMTVALIGAVANSIKNLHEVNQKYAIIEAAKTHRRGLAGSDDRPTGLLRPIPGSTTVTGPGGVKHVRWK